MNLPVTIRHEAEADIVKAALWYDTRQSGLGVEFLAAVRVAITQATERPLSGLLLRRKPHVRRVLTPRFPYRVFYLIRGDRVIVFAVLHGHRDEKRWGNRI